MVKGSHREETKKKISESMKQYWQHKKGNHDIETIKKPDPGDGSQENKHSTELGGGNPKDQTIEFTGGKKQMSEKDNSKAETFICGSCGYEMKTRLSYCPNCGLQFEE